MKKILYLVGVLVLIVILVFAYLNFFNQSSEKEEEIVKTKEKKEIEKEEEKVEIKNDTQQENVSIKDDKLKIYFIQTNNETTQGEAILIKKDEFEMLVNSGPESGPDKLIQFLEEKEVDKLDVFVTTGSSTDLYGGLEAVYNKFGAEELWRFETRSYNNPEYNKKTNLTGTTEIFLKRGQVKNFYDIKVKMLNPANEDSNPDLKINSAVLKVSYNNFCILLTAELVSGGQRNILNRNDVKCQVLKIADHGLDENNRQSDILVNAVSPKIAIISGGTTKNEERVAIKKILENKEIELFENYVGGTVVVETDGTTYSVNYEN